MHHLKSCIEELYVTDFSAECSSGTLLADKSLSLMASEQLDRGGYRISSPLSLPLSPADEGRLAYDGVICWRIPRQYQSYTLSIVDKASGTEVAEVTIPYVDVVGFLPLVVDQNSKLFSYLMITKEGEDSTWNIHFKVFAHLTISELRSRTLDAQLMIRCLDQQSRYFERLVELDPGNEVIVNWWMANLRSAIDATPKRDAKLMDRLYDFCKALETYRRISSNRAIIREGASFVCKEIDWDSTVPPQLSNLLAGLETRLAIDFGDAELINAGLSKFFQAINSSVATNELRLSAHIPIAISYERRAAFIRDIVSADEALRRFHEILNIGLGDDMPYLYSLAGQSHFTRFQISGNEADLLEALKLYNIGVKVSQNDPNTLNDLGTTLLQSYRYFKKSSYLQEAISALRRSIHLTPENHPDLPPRLTNLSSALEMRYTNLTTDISDIHEALDAQQRANQYTPSEHPRLPSRLANLGVCNLRLYEHTQDIVHLESAIDIQRRAIDLCRDPETLLSGLFNLGQALRVLAINTGNEETINEAMSIIERCICLTPEGHEKQAARIAFFADLHQLLYSTTNNIADLNEAARLHAEALQAASEMTDGLATYYMALAETHLLLYQVIHDIDNLKAGMGHLRDGANSVASPPSSRFQCARRLAQVLYQLGQEHKHDILESYQLAVELLALIGGLERTVSDRHKQLQFVSEVTLEAASVALSIGHVLKGLEWLEQGRCLVWSQLNHMHQPWDVLREHDSSLASRIQQVADALEDSGFTKDMTKLEDASGIKLKAQEEVVTRIELAQEWETLISAVRNIQGFEDFLRPAPAVKLLQWLPDEGIIVVINIHDIGCDAICLSKVFDEPIHIPLAAFSPEKAEELGQRLRGHLVRLKLLAREGVDGNDDTDRALRPVGQGRCETSIVEHVLRDLWVLVGEPILKGLDIKPAETPTTRVWWCTTGALAFLPLHAAGLYTGPDARMGETTMSDYVVSSYTPTVTALTERVRVSKRALTTQQPLGSGMLTVAQANAKGLPSIPGTLAEVQRVEQVASRGGISYKTLIDKDATVERTISGLQEYSSVHLACHGTQDAGDPFSSGFFLGDGILDLSTIAQQNSKSAALAFLSACQTGTGDANLSDEVVHLAAGMLAAGYREVVATMWSISDSHAPQVAEEFYMELLSGVDEGASGGAAWRRCGAYALHKAIKGLRNRLGNGKSFKSWVPYVHYGL